MTRKPGNRSLDFFDRQFARQIAQREFALNPFEQAIIPFLSGEVLDLGCGLGNLAQAAARNGCTVTALDASRSAIEHLARCASQERLRIEAREADLRSIAIRGQFDCVVAIGLLMFLPPPAARAALTRIQSLVRPSGLAAVNVLVEGTTYLDMFDPAGYCLFRERQLPEAFAAWAQEYLAIETFPAPGDTIKRFCTVVARRPSGRLPKRQRASRGK